MGDLSTSPAASRRVAGAAAALFGVLIAVFAFAPSLLGDCVVWCFFGRGAGATMTGLAGLILLAIGMTLFIRR